MEKENDEENVQYLSKKAEVLILIGCLCLLALEIVFLYKIFT